MSDERTLMQQDYQKRLEEAEKRVKAAESADATQMDYKRDLDNVRQELAKAQAANKLDRQELQLAYEKRMQQQSTEACEAMNQLKREKQKVEDYLFAE